MNVQTEIEKRKDQIKQLQSEIHSLEAHDIDIAIKENIEKYIGKCMELSHNEYILAKSVSDNAIYGTLLNLIDDDVCITTWSEAKISKVKRVISKDEFIALQDKIITRACQLLSVK